MRKNRPFFTHDRFLPFMSGFLLFMSGFHSFFPFFIRSVHPVRAVYTVRAVYNGPGKY